MQDVDDDDGLMGDSASSSRARMLAQQRDLQIKRRASAAQSGGMIRSSIDSTSGVNPMKKSIDGQFTPSLRQFSAPKAVKDPYADQSAPELVPMLRKPYICIVTNALIQLSLRRWTRWK
jgi:hypothetical protein